MDQSEINEMRISYEKDTDVLYLSFGEPKEGIDEEVYPGVYVRIDQEKHSFVGFTIIDFEKRFSTTQENSIPLNLTKIAGMNISA